MNLVGMKYRLQNAVGDGGDTGGSVAPVQTQAPSPNANWQNNAALDAQGNPITPAPNTPATPPATPETPATTPPATPPATPPEKSPETPPTSTVDMSSPVIKQVEQLIVDAGLSAQAVAKAVSEGNGEVTPAILQALVAKHGEAVASLVANQLKGFNDSTVAKATARDTAVYDQVKDAFKGMTEQGGKETWTELAGWAKENIPEAERRDINGLLSQGGLAASYAINDLVSRFKSSDSFMQPASLEEGGNTNQESGVQSLSRSDYQREFRALEAKGHVYGQSQELAKLDQRREAGMRRGQ